MPAPFRLSVCLRKFLCVSDWVKGSHSFLLPLHLEASPPPRAVCLVPGDFLFSHVG